MTKRDEIDKAREEIALLYCKWCPKDCKGLSKRERIGCLASGGFADELKELGYHKFDPTKLTLIGDEEILRLLNEFIAGGEERGRHIFGKMVAQAQLDWDRKSGEGK